MMNQSVQLTLEQEFKQRIFSDRIKSLPEEQVQNLAIELYEQMMLKENTYKALIKEEWGINSDPSFFHN